MAEGSSGKRKEMIKKKKNGTSGRRKEQYKV